MTEHCVRPAGQPHALGCAANLSLSIEDSLGHAVSLDMQQL